MRPFTMNGKEYGYDEPVDVSGIEVRRVRQMFEARLIDADDSAAPKQKPQAPAPRVEAVPEPAPAPQASQKASLRHKGFGKYEVVDAASNVIAGPLSREQAEVELKKHL